MFPDNSLPVSLCGIECLLSDNQIKILLFAIFSNSGAEPCRCGPLTLHSHINLKVKVKYLIINQFKGSS